MKLLTEREKVRTVAAAWAKQYSKNGPYGNDAEKQEIAKALSALDPETATASDVAAIIGNNSWCGPCKCDECGKEAETAVQLGEEPDYESATAVVCFDCVQKAMTLMMPNAGIHRAAEVRPVE
jgi:hypothetical protein